MRGVVLLAALAAVAGTAAGQDEAEYRRRLKKVLAVSREWIATPDLPEVMEGVSRQTGVPIRLEPEALGVLERPADLPGRVRELLAGLQSDEWAKREEATATAVRLGIPGLEELARHASADDPEVQSRIERIRAGVATNALRLSLFFPFFPDPPNRYPRRGTAADFLDWTLRPDGEWIVTPEGVRVAPAGKFARPFDRTRILALYLGAAVAGHDPFLTSEIRWRERLSVYVNWAREATTLADVHDFIRDNYHVPIVRSEGAGKWVEGGEFAVSLRCRDLPCADALERMASVNNLRVDWSNRDEIVLRAPDENEPRSPDEEIATSIARWVNKDVRGFHERFGELAEPLAIPPGTSLAGITRPGGLVLALARATGRTVLADRAAWRVLEHPKSPFPADSRDLSAWLAAEGIAVLSRDDLLVLLGP
ncbi:MAG: hypothetical protein HY720_25145 [Planctomycetes bacterium]|nr:hypothetical protein [Planctomycetota bacterium]